MAKLLCDREPKRNYGSVSNFTIAPSGTSQAVKHKFSKIKENPKSSDDADISGPSGSVEGQILADSDAARLAEMGYSQEMSRGFSIWSVLGTAFSLTNSWFGLTASMVTGINAGGPVLLIYGIIIVALISTCTAITLSELASAIPNAGGQYYWTSKLASKRYANIASYLTGWFAYAGSIFTSASVALGMGSACVGMYQLTHPDLVIEAWHVIVAYELFILVCYFFNCWGKILPKISQFTLAVSLISFAIILITVPAKAPTHRSARFVFATFINNTGWQNGAIAFITGLVNPAWAFSCLDCATHLAEEVAQPERVIPIAIMSTVAIGFITSWFFIVSMMFSIQDLTAITTTPTLVPIIEIFHEAIDAGGAIALEILIVLTGAGCLTACQTWQARLCWSFSRDKGLPGHEWLKKVNKTLDTPLIAHTVSTIINGLVGLLYLGSSAAFHSMVTATIVLLYISYSIPVICLLVKGRNNIPHGPFWLGKMGLFANCVLLTWTLFTFVFFSLPVAMPVTPGNMNYVSAVYAVVVVVIMTDWFLRGKREYCNSAVKKERRESFSSRSHSSTIRIVTQGPDSDETAIA